MIESRFLCLAVSRKMNGYCIAGIDMDSGKWIRPVSAHSHGELWNPEVMVKEHGVKNPRPMRPLDIVQLRFSKYVGNAGQPENWMLDPNSAVVPIPILGNAVNDMSSLEQIRGLADQSSSLSFLNRTPGKEISHREIEREPLSNSLCVVSPTNLAWTRTTSFKNRPRIEGQFDFGGRNTRCYFSLTDVVWEAKLLELTANGQTLDAYEVPGVNANLEILLTISLGDLFETTQCHYKLIAGVLLLPRRHTPNG
jgi:hypothetical protein